jgi:hypothetical protein
MLVEAWRPSQPGDRRSQPTVASKKLVRMAEVHLVSHALGATDGSSGFELGR